jgi:hypothetical protein
MLLDGNRSPASATTPAQAAHAAFAPPAPISMYLPFDAGPFRMAMGLSALKAEDWIEIDDRYGEEMALRRRLLAEQRDEVFAALPESTAGRREVLDLLAEHLPARYPAWFARRGDRLENRLTGESWDVAAPAADPLDIAGRLVQEDLCLLAESPEGPRLVAAVLCFPSRWRLADKIGRPLAAIHGPVPLYEERLARPVDRFLNLLKAEKPVVRVNWSVHDNPALFQPTGHGRTADDRTINAENAGDRLVLRVERQTLRRLMPSGTVLFGIRTHIRPLREIAAAADIARSLAGAVRALPLEVLRYKSLAPFREALLAYLDRRAA